MQGYREQDARIIATQIEDTINTTAFKADDVTEAMIEGTSESSPMHRTLQDSMFRLAVSFIYRLADAYSRDKVDARNEWAGHAAAKIVDLINEEGEDVSNIEMNTLAIHYDDLFQERDQMEAEARNS